jgi:hypothetical protein
MRDSRQHGLPTSKFVMDLPRLIMDRTPSRAGAKGGREKQRE